jgi:PAS domain S-box-containing protein
MEKEVKILILEHDVNDLELLQYALKKSELSYISQIVETRETFEKALTAFRPDIVLSDFSLPSFDGFTAFKIKEQVLPETPFIVVSGTIGDENAVDLIKTGVTDYVLKEKLYQLVPKIKRAIDEAEVYKQKKNAEKNLRQQEEQLHKIMTLSLDIIYTLDPEGKFVTVSPACKLILDYQPEELIGRSILDIVYTEDKNKLSEALANLKYGIDIINLECRYIRKSGAIVTLLWSVRWHSDELGYGVAKEITEIKKAEEKIRHSEKRFRAILQNSTDGLTLMREDGTIIERSPAALKILGLSYEEAKTNFRTENVHPADVFIVKEALDQIKKNPSLLKTIEFRMLLNKNAIYGWIEAIFHNLLADPAVNAIVLNFRDITERKQAELALEQSEEKYRSLFELSPLPMWVFDVETYAFLNVNEAAIRHYGYSKEEFLQMTLIDIRPEVSLEELQATVEANIITGAYFQTMVNHLKKNGELIQVEIQSNMIDYEGKLARLVLAEDISERVKYIQAIEDQNKKLRDIAWKQSHVVRAPLARLMGLVSLLQDYSYKETQIAELINHLMASSLELDKVIRDIVKQTDNIDSPVITE